MSNTATPNPSPDTGDPATNEAFDRLVNERIGADIARLATSLCVYEACKS
jgi:hypothetical protein